MDASERGSAKALRWRELVRRQKESGLSVRAFCRQAGVREPSFYAWRRKLAELETAGSKPQPAPAFVPAIVEGPSPRDEPIVLQLASGVALRLPASLPMARVAELVLRLEQRGAS